MQTRTQIAIANRFVQILERITPNTPEHRIFAQHQDSIEVRLTNAFRANRVERIGSYVRGSAIRQDSDIDLLLVLTRDEVRWGGEYKSSTTILNQVRNQIQDRYTSTDVGRDGQAIVVSFSDGQHPVDIVPGFFYGPGENNYPVFCIPDGAGGWIKTSPQLHNRYLASADTCSGGKLKSVARIVKYWSTLRSSTSSLSGFHTELLLAQEDVCVGAKTHAECLAEAFKLLANRHCRALQDPAGISGLIRAAGTDAKRMALDATIQSVSDHCDAALWAEYRQDTQEAIRQWNIVFNDAYPR